ncbi:Hypothetical predicted protein [Lecanosticta acicola]|uniref:Uncharacterized protein n=1 Tax=Lecanosticta acicola TaxID=111012 RepID=A0AAI8Z0L6_9PEZI|nr:Hypothetical predicted protein [Lecanosticta acicola]
MEHVETHDRADLLPLELDPTADVIGSASRDEVDGGVISVPMNVPELSVVPGEVILLPEELELAAVERRAVVLVEPVGDQLGEAEAESVEVVFIDEEIDPIVEVVFRMEVAAVVLVVLVAIVRVKVA